MSQLTYMPVFRLKQEEKKVFSTFLFGKRIYPLIEIIKERDRKEPTMRKGVPLPPKRGKSFSTIHLSILSKIQAEKVFVDLPIHLNVTRRSNADTLSFITEIKRDRKKRTDYIISLKTLAKKIIPVISSYHEYTGEISSIKLQERDLRSHYSQLAFRTFTKNFNSDFAQIVSVAQHNDYIILDLKEDPADPNDEDLLDVTERLKKFTKCPWIIVRSAIKESISNVKLDHGKIISDADNHLLSTFKDLGASSFGDYAGIKRGSTSEGGAVSPGFIYYDPIKNSYYGFRGSVNSEGKTNGRFDDFADIIVPAAISSPATSRMRSSPLLYICEGNKGWQLLDAIANELENWRNQGLFKRISMYHYLHCLKTRINAGHFDN